MHDYEKYESKKRKLKQYLDHLDKRCKSHFGPLNKYEYPVENPYVVYTDDHDFKHRELKKKNENEYIKLNNKCKFMADVSSKVDKKGRYYIHATDKKECELAKGHWDETALSRINKFDNGVCWKTEQDMTCAAVVKNNDVLKSYAGKFNKDMGFVLSEESKRCDKTPGCTFQQQTAFTHDCVVGERSEVLGPVHMPPSQMPLEKFEKFLEEWYVKSKHGRFPETGELLGKGDRCSGASEEEDGTSSLPAAPSIIEALVPFRNMDPRKKEDAAILQRYMPKKEFDLFKYQWVQKTKHDAEFENDSVESFYDKMDKVFFETDYKAPKATALKRFLPSIPQSVINMVMKNDALKHGKMRGMLAWHSTGSGKTCTAAGVMDSFWDTDRQIIFASSIDAIASNPPFKFHECCLNLFGRFQMPPFKGADTAQSLAFIEEAFKKRRVRFLSFAKLSNRVMNAIEYKKTHKLSGGGGVKKEKTHQEILAGDDYVELDKCILIIDEVHNLFRPLANQKKQHELLEAELIDPSKHPNLKVIILTATPGDNIPDVLKLLNITRKAGDPIITSPDISSSKDLMRFKKQIRGMISYFDMSGDDTKFPIVKDSEPLKLPMSATQYEKYLDAYKTLTALHKNYDALAKKNELDKYYLPIRKYSNSLFNFLKDMNLSDFSSKMPYVLDNLKKYHDEKHYLYSAFGSRAGHGGHGVYALAAEMEKIGYVKMTVAEARKINKAKKLPAKGVKRYIMATNVDLGEEGGNAGANLTELLKIYNHPENKNGELIHIMLASNKYSESIDLKDVRNVHMLEPLITMASELQIIGRARRYCSLANLNRSKGEWAVKLHRYMADKPVIVPVDKGPERQKLQAEIEDIEAQITNAGSKEELKSAQKAYKEREKDVAKLEKLVEKGKATPGKVAVVKQELIVLQKGVDAAEFAMNNAKEIVAQLKKELSEKKKDLKALDKPSKVSKVGVVENIEDRILAESRERFKLLFTVYNCMKEVAVDCQLLETFHKTTGVSVKCESFN